MAVEDLKHGGGYDHAMKHVKMPQPYVYGYKAGGQRGQSLAIVVNAARSA
jgi:hypothetical protein